MLKEMLTQEELERLRRSFNKPVQRETEKPVLFQERVYSTGNYFGRKNKRCLTTGNYIIINGRKVPIEAYGEIIAEDVEE
jgi:hypothetical protein